MPTEKMPLTYNCQALHNLQTIGGSSAEKLGQPFQMWLMKSVWKWTNEIVAFTCQCPDVPVTPDVHGDFQRVDGRLCFISTGNEEMEYNTLTTDDVYPDIFILFRLWLTQPCLRQARWWGIQNTFRTSSRKNAWA